MSKKSTVVEPEIVEENRAVIAQNRDGIVKTIARQIEVVQKAELVLLFQRLRLGALVKNSVILLGLDSKGGRGRVGEGVKGWWDENFKGEDGQPVIPYRTLMSWVSAAEKLTRMLDLGKDVKINGRQGCIPMREDEVLALLAKDPEKVVGKEAKILKSAEKVANGMTMRQMLLWGDDEEARGKGKRGRPAGTKADLSKKPDATDALAAARAAWSKIIVPADREAVALQAAAKLLNAEDVENAKIVLQNLMDMLKERAEELKIRI